MSRLPGEPLLGAPFTEQKIKGLAAAVRRMHVAVPSDVLAGLLLRPGHQREIISWIRVRASVVFPATAPGVVREALEHRLSWPAGSDMESAGWPDAAPVFGPGDGNVANYLWDGHRVRAFELAEITEHVVGWVDHPLDVVLFLEQFDFTRVEAARLRDCRRLLALVWLLLLLIGREGILRAPPNSRPTVSPGCFPEQIAFPGRGFSSGEGR